MSGTRESGTLHSAPRESFTAAFLIAGVVPIVGIVA